MNLQWETLKKCPICQDAQIKPGTKPNIWVCLGCGVTFLNPRMTDESTTAYYKGIYRNEVSGLNGFNTIDLDNQRKRAAIQVEACRPYLKGVETCIEIGCSAGYLMEALTESGIDCTGVESDQRYHAIEPAKRFSVYADLEQAPRRRYDLAALSHVLEHLNHPLEYLRNLVDGYGVGMVLVEVPNLAIVTDTVMKQHPFGFTEKTLDGLFARLDLTPVFKTTHNLGRPVIGPLAQKYILAVYAKADQKKKKGSKKGGGDGIRKN